MATITVKDLRVAAVMKSDALASVAGGLTLASSPHGLHWAVAHPNDPWSKAFAAQFGPGWQNYLLNQ